MVKKRFQNKIAGSDFTFPFCAVVAAILWWLPECTFSLSAALGMVVCGLATYIVMETNNRMLIIRMRTRMMSCVWMVLAASLPFMHPLGNPIVAATLLCASYFMLFRCYEQHRPQANTFHAFLLLSIGSFFAPVMLLLAIPFYIYLVGFLRSLTKKAFWAGILGIVAPFWCYAIWSFLTKDLQGFVQHLVGMAQFEMPCLGALTALPFSVQVSIGVVALLSIVSIIHYLRYNYDDKIRVRMYLYIYVSQTFLLLAFLLLQPAHYETTMALLVASASPLIAHYLALSRSIFCSIFFVLSLLLIVAMATLNLWMTSFSIF